jgi:hypothetical protein
MSQSTLTPSSRELLQVTVDGGCESQPSITLSWDGAAGADGHAFSYSDYDLAGGVPHFSDAWPGCSARLPPQTGDARVLGYFCERDILYVNFYIPSKIRRTKDSVQRELTQSGNDPRESGIRFDAKQARTSAAFIPDFPIATEPKRDIPASIILLMIKMHAPSGSLPPNCFDSTRGFERRQYFFLMVLLLLTASLPAVGYARSIDGPAHGPSPTSSIHISEREVAAPSTGERCRWSPHRSE